MIDYRLTNEYRRLVKLQDKRREVRAKVSAITRQIIDMMHAPGRMDTAKLEALRVERAGLEFDADQYSEQIRELLGL